MPDPSTIHRWSHDDPEIMQAIASARVVGFDVIAADCLKIADNSELDFIECEDGEQPVPNTEHIQRSKLRVETRLKLLAKWDPKRYGDAISVEHSGGTNDTVTVMSEHRRAELRAKKQQAIARRHNAPALNGANGHSTNGHN